MNDTLDVIVGLRQRRSIHQKSLEIFEQRAKEDEAAEKFHLLPVWFRGVTQAAKEIAEITVQIERELVLRDSELSWAFEKEVA